MYVSKYFFEIDFFKNRHVSISKGIEGKFIKTPSLTDKKDQRTFHIDRSLGKIIKSSNRNLFFSLI